MTYSPQTPPESFDALTASSTDLVRYDLPQRPDPHTQPGLAALWEKQASRYRSFEHLPPGERDTEFPVPDANAQALGLEPRETCGYSLTSTSAPFASLFITFTVPNLRHSPGPLEPNHFRIFAGLGFLDVHVEMTVDPAQNVTSTLTALGVSQTGLAVEPGDVISASMCLDSKPPGRANYVLANETRSQTVNFSFDSHFPPAVTINAGISRGIASRPLNPLARFGAVYFDDITAHSPNGPRSLLEGEAVTMVDRNGSKLARTHRLNDFAFKVTYEAS